MGQFKFIRKIKILVKVAIHIEPNENATSSSVVIMSDNINSAVSIVSSGFCLGIRKEFVS